MSVENTTSTINICMTSYPRRIGNCAKVIQSVLDNTVLPDRIYLTLSSVEFPRYEHDIPIELYRLVMTSDRVVINWVDTNWKSFKKVFPVLPYLEDDDIIIDIDDDMLLPRDFIESRMADFELCGRSRPITSNCSPTVNMDNLVMSAYSLFQKRMLRGYERLLEGNVVLNTFNDDRTYLYLCHLNGYRLYPCTKWCVFDPQGKTRRLDVVGRSDYKYAVGGEYDRLVAPVVARLSGGRKIGDCFNLFSEMGVDEDNKHECRQTSVSKSPSNQCCPVVAFSPSTAKLFQYNPKKPLKHDLVYVLGNGSRHDNLEIRISITSMLKFCSHWIGEIYVVGENPGIHNTRVKHIWAPDITKSNKDANIIHKVLTAINKIPNLTNNFLFCSDDILVTKKSDWEDFAPRQVFEYRQDDQFRRQLMQESRDNRWDVLLLKTLDRFLGVREHIYFYEPHIFAPINKRKFKQMCSQVDYTNERNVMIMSLWFNWLGIKDPPKKFDHQSVFTSQDVNLHGSPARHISYNDRAFSSKMFRDQLIQLVTMDEFK